MRLCIPLLVMALGLFPGCAARQQGLLEGSSLALNFLAEQQIHDHAHLYFPDCQEPLSLTPLTWDQRLEGMVSTLPVESYQVEGCGQVEVFVEIPGTHQWVLESKLEGSETEE